MARAYLVGGSPSPTSRSSQLLELVGQDLRGRGVSTELLNLRDLPPADLIGGNAERGPIRDSVDRLDSAGGLILASPIYKASLSGLTKVWLDLLPQFALRGKVVLPLATGASLTSVLAIDYGIRPILNSMGTLHVLPGCFILESWLDLSREGHPQLEAKPKMMLDELIAAFVAALSAESP